HGFLLRFSLQHFLRYHNRILFQFEVQLSCKFFFAVGFCNPLPDILSEEAECHGKKYHHKLQEIFAPFLLASYLMRMFMYFHNFSCWLLVACFWSWLNTF